MLLFPFQRAFTQFAQFHVASKLQSCAVNLSLGDFGDKALNQ